MYKGYHTRYHVPFYLWQMKLAWKHSKLPKYLSLGHKKNGALTLIRQCFVWFFVPSF